MGLAEKIGGFKDRVKNTVGQKIDRVGEHIVNILVGETPPITLQVSPDDARIAFTFFAHASETYPASVAAQASAIALKCQENKKRPDLLKDALVGDPNRILILTRAADRIHRAAGRNITIDALMVREVVVADFSLAAHLMTLSPDQLMTICQTYDAYKDNRPNPREEVLQGVVEGFLGYRPKVFNLE